MLVKYGCHIRRKELLIHIDPIAAQGRHLVHQRLRGMFRLNVQAVIRDDSSRLYLWFKRLDGLENKPVKGDDQYVGKHVDGAYFREDRFSDLWIASLHAIAFAGLQLNIGLYMSPCQFEHFT